MISNLQSDDAFRNGVSATNPLPNPDPLLYAARRQAERYHIMLPLAQTAAQLVDASIRDKEAQVAAFAESRP